MLSEAPTYIIDAIFAVAEQLLRLHSAGAGNAYLVLINGIVKVLLYLKTCSTTKAAISRYASLPAANSLLETVCAITIEPSDPSILIAVPANTDNTVKYKYKCCELH